MSCLCLPEVIGYGPAALPEGFGDEEEGSTQIVERQDLGTPLRPCVRACQESGESGKAERQSGYPPVTEGPSGFRGPPARCYPYTGRESRVSFRRELTSLSIHSYNVLVVARQICASKHGF